MLTEALYSCKICEVSLTSADCAELGISEEEGAPHKRYQAVVIDGTASGILSSLPPLERDHVYVELPKKSKSSIYKTQKLVKSYPHRTLLKKLMKLAKECFRDWRITTSTSNVAVGRSSRSISTLNTIRFWIKKSGTGKHPRILEPKKLLKETEVKVAHLLTEEATCLCTTFSTTNDTNNTNRALGQSHRHQKYSQECLQVAKVFAKEREEEVVLHLVRSLFSIDRGNPAQKLRLAALSNRASQNDIPEDHVDEQTANPNQQGNERGSSRPQDAKTDIPDDGTEEIVAGGSGNTSPKKTRQSRIDSSREVVRDDSSNEEHDDDSQDLDCSEDADAEMQKIYDSVVASRFVRGTWVTLKPLFGIMHSQFLEATLLLLDFVLLQHVAMPYVGRIE